MFTDIIELLKKKKQEALDYLAKCDDLLAQCGYVEPVVEPVVEVVNDVEEAVDEPADSVEEAVDEPADSVEEAVDEPQPQQIIY